MKTLILPEYWASYLINGDHSGLSDQEKDEIDSFITKHKLGWCVGCGDDPYFHWRNDANNLGSTVVEFYFEEY